MRITTSRLWGALILAAVASGCSRNGSTSPGPGGVSSQIIGVTDVNGNSGTLHSGSVPTGGSLIVTAPTNLSVINGGTAVLVISSQNVFYRLAVAIQGESGYYELSLPSGVTVVQLLVSLSQSLTAGQLPITVSAGNAGGQYGPADVVNATLTQVGTGDVQVSLTWGVPSDVDLHVVDPSGEEIYYANRTSASGGVLDLDSNAGCVIDNVDNENVTWPHGNAPSGKYTVRVDYWNSCGVASTAYAVTVSVAGRAPQVFTGTFTGQGDEGGLGAGTLITTFTK